jgi:CO/xanthine dehydrogenase FAD-binding subunit
LRIKEYYAPTTLDEAYNLFQEELTTIISGGTWLKLLPKAIEKAIDLSKLGLDQVVEKPDTIEIGSMVTLEQLRQHPTLLALADGVIPKAINHIMGVPIRNIATIGGSVAGKFGFSDIITPLLTMGTIIEFSHMPDMSLEDYMAHKKIANDFITKIIIASVPGKAHFKSVKKTSNDFPILNICVSKLEGKYKIAVGARPAGALLAHKAMDFINEQTSITEDIISETATIAMTELTFGTNSRGSNVYRTSIAEVLIKRGLKEVQDAK